MHDLPMEGVKKKKSVMPCAWKSGYTECGDAIAICM